MRVKLELTNGMRGVYKAHHIIAGLSWPAGTTFDGSCGAVFLMDPDDGPLAQPARVLVTQPIEGVLASIEGTTGPWLKLMDFNGDRVFCRPQDVASYRSVIVEDKDNAEGTEVVIKVGRGPSSVTVPIVVSDLLGEITIVLDLADLPA
jgi:hypothetical protein